MEGGRVPSSRPKAAHEANKGRGRQTREEERRNGRFYYHYSQRLGTSAARDRECSSKGAKLRRRMPPPAEQGKEVWTVSLLTLSLLSRFKAAP